MAWRLFVLSLYVVAGIGSGYLLWGTRTGNLTEALNRMILEQDALRVVINEQTRVIDRLTAVPDIDPRELDRMRRSLTDALASLEGTTASLDRANTDLAGARAALSDSSVALRRCNATQEHLQVQLEQCVFEKADLMRSAPRRSSVETPRRGTSTVTESVVIPTLPQRYPAR